MVDSEPRVINDEVYGLTEISEPVLLDLIDSKTLQRTKGISQLGLPQEYHYLKTFSRFDHNVGAMIVVKRLGGSLDEQIAAILHDASHTAFSHMIDWIVGSQERADFQDNGHGEFLRNSDAAQVLDKYGLDIEKYLDYHPYTLLERDTPSLCADRIDYGLRELKVTGFEPGIVPGCINSLVNFNGRIAFDNLLVARDFGFGFLKLQTEDWGNPKPISRYILFVNRLKEAMELGILQLSDFKEDDSFVLEKIKSGDSGLWQRFEELRKPLEEIPDYPEIRGLVVKHKFRYVDPEFLEDRQMIRLSQVDRAFSEAVESAKQNNDTGIML